MLFEIEGVCDVAVPPQGRADHWRHRGRNRTHDDPGDARRAVLALTDEGAEKLADLSAVHRAEIRRFREQMDDILTGLD